MTFRKCVDDSFAESVDLNRKNIKIAVSGIFHNSDLQLKSGCNLLLLMNLYFDFATDDL